MLTLFHNYLLVACMFFSQTFNIGHYQVVRPSNPLVRWPRCLTSGMVLCQDNFLQ